MARCPFATWRPLSENETQETIDPTQLILHTAVDAPPSNSSLWGFFERRDVVVESTFYIKLGGEIEQYLDTTVRADANRTANVRAISVETEDDGTLRPWSPPQMDSIKRLGEWVMAVHPKVARRVCPADDQPGWGYHSMWGSPSPWTPAVGKTCPGAPRIAQFKTELVPWLATNPQEDDPLAIFDTIDEFNAAVREAVGAEFTQVGDATRTAVFDLARRGALYGANFLAVADDFVQGGTVYYTDLKTKIGFGQGSVLHTQIKDDLADQSLSTAARVLPAAVLAAIPDA